ncbi:MAG: putative transposable element-derived protein 1 [Streblomastix strix]|uniref:Putative transposable element-derived protein 1 n=1 Tax=Streblomastix strix TaxID=222440 RepID=A0A5J4ULX7_9EUKA|nr:MAG: putative transposable element-derived protein 1 [Streblomastix strix]
MAQNYELNLSFLAGMCVDGAASMVGIKTGLVTRIKIDFPEIEPTHSVAHRFNLVSEDSINGEDVIELKYAENTCLTLWHFFPTSPKNAALLAETHIRKQTEQIKLKRLCHTRQLSCFASIRATKLELTSIWKTLQILINNRNATAIGLRNLTTKKKFIFSLYILDHILEQLSETSKDMQKQNFSFDQLEPIILNCTQSLKRIKDNNQIESQIQSNWYLYETEAGVLNDDDKKSITKSQQTYIQLTIDSIKERFKEIDIITSFSIFNPNCAPLTEDKLEGYGEQYLINILNKKWNLFRREVNENKRILKQQIQINEKMDPNDVKQQQSEQKETQNNLLQEKGKFFFDALKQWRLARNNLLKNFKDKSQRFVCQRLCKDEKAFENVPIIRSVAKYALTMPLSNAPPERGFSQLKNVKSNNRNRLLQSSLQSLMNISINGLIETSSEFIQFVFNEWKLTQRRIPQIKLQVQGSGPDNEEEEIEFEDFIYQIENQSDFVND